MSITTENVSNVLDVNKPFETKDVGSDNLDGKKSFKIKNPDEHDKHMIIQSQNAGMAYPSHGNPYYPTNYNHPGINNNPYMYLPFQQYPNFAAFLESFMLAIKNKEISKGRTNKISNDIDENENVRKIVNDTNTNT